MIVLLSGNFHWVNTINDVFFFEGPSDHKTVNKVSSKPVKIRLQTVIGSCPTCIKDCTTVQLNTATNCPTQTVIKGCATNCLSKNCCHRLPKLRCYKNVQLKLTWKSCSTICSMSLEPVQVCPHVSNFVEGMLRKLQEKTVHCSDCHERLLFFLENTFSLCPTIKPFGWISLSSQFFCWGCQAWTIFLRWG